MSLQIEVGELPLLRVPEFIIHKALVNALKFVKDDYDSVVDKTESFLFLLTSGVVMQRYDFWEQAQEVFLKRTGDTRELLVDLMFNMQRDGAPTIHIVTPGESPGQNGIGNDEGYQIEIVDTVNKEYRNVYTRRYKATYDVVITGDNSNEVIMIYHIVRALLTSLTVHLSLSGLENLSFSGQDLAPYVDLAPKNMYVRALRLGLEYETSTVPFQKSKIYTNMIFNGVPISTAPTTTTTTIPVTTTTTTI